MPSMARNCIVVNLDRCIGCWSCELACKLENDVALGERWNKVVQVEPFGEWPHVSTYWLPTMCQQCEDSPCTHVCPTGASYRDEKTGIVLVDKEKCIGCKYCMMACPYGVRYLNQTERVVEKCTLCEQRTSQGELPQCVAQCGARARFFGDLDEGIESFRGPCGKTMGDFCEPFDGEHDVHTLTDVGNRPSFLYILRDHTWRGKE